MVIAVSPKRPRKDRAAVFGLSDVEFIPDAAGPGYEEVADDTDRSARAATARRP